MKYSEALDIQIGFGCSGTYELILVNEKRILTEALTLVTPSGKAVIVDLLTNDFNVDNSGYCANMDVKNVNKKAFVQAIKAIKQAIDNLKAIDELLEKPEVVKALAITTCFNYNSFLCEHLNIDIEQASKLWKRYVADNKVKAEAEYTAAMIKKFNY